LRSRFEKFICEEKQKVKLNFYSETTAAERPAKAAEKAGFTEILLA